MNMSTLAEPLVWDVAAAGSAPFARGTTALRWVLFASVAALFVLSMPMLVGHVYVADDLGAFHLPLRSFYAEQLAGGESWDWMPGLFGGFYLTGEGQLGAYHPLHLLLYRWLPLELAFDLELLLSYPALLAGTFLLLRRFARDNAAALFGAACFTFGGFNLLHFVHPNGIAIVAHIPWLLWLIDGLICGPRDIRRIVGLSAIIALLTGSQLLLGYPQYVWFSLLAEGALAAVLLWPAVNRSKIGAVFCTAKLLGLLIGAVQLLPTIDALGDSTRITADTQFSATGSLHPLNVVQLFAPYLFEHRVVGQNTHELGFYFGAVPCVLCCWLLLQPKTWGRDRRAILRLIAGLLAVLLLACGEFAPLYQLQQHLPLIERFRFPCRAILLVQLVLAVVTGLAFRRCILDRAEKTQGGARFVLWLPTMASVVLSLLAPLVWPERVANPWLVWAGPMLIGSATALIYFARLGTSAAVYALILFSVADGVAYGASYSILNRTGSLEHFIAEASRPPEDDGSRVIADLSITRQPLEVGNRMLLAGVRRLDGYTGLEPMRTLDYTDRNQLRLAGVGWIYNSREPANAWTRLEIPLPRFRFVSRALVSDSFENWTTDAFENYALVDSDLELQPGKSGDITLVTDRPGCIELLTETSTEQLLVVAESYHDGWRATVDEQPVPVLRVNRDFLGCLVPQGTHEVRLHFSPLSLRLGKGVTAGGLSLCVAALVLAWFPWPSKRTRRAD
jgi:hypothetical protein